MHRRFLEPLGLTFPQYLVILELLETSPCLVSRIGAKLGLDTGTNVHLLKRMEQSGLIAKKRDPLDEGRVLVELKPAGQALQASVLAFCCRSAVAAGSASASRRVGQTPNVLASCTT
ncbi:MarR family winged helix-turn-helix transcriptional regulator [Paracoccus sp. PAMC 22219]|uniref:MarR family winged helix-turn-helix transcriptional regulator n=1 Tax=Paracoccus sp. PAMC 22219 TaxID=1569209 RepID=UPI0035A65235